MSNEATEQVTDESGAVAPEGGDAAVSTEAGASTEAATAKGHQSKEDYVNNGGDPGQWQNPDVFMALKGPLAKIKDQSKRIRAMESDFTARTVNANRLHNMQVDQMRADLVTKRDTAVEDADVNQVNKIQNQIDTLVTLPDTAPVQNVEMSEDLQTWNASPQNKWITEQGPKSQYAHTQFNQYRAQGMDDMQAIKMMENDVSHHFPAVNSNITGAPMAEGGSKPGAKAPTQEVTMQTLTSEESRIWRNSSGMWKNEAAFLQSVKDTRSEDNE